MRDKQTTLGPLRAHTPLAVRGSSPRTFRSLGLFAEAGLLFCGGYLLAGALASPLSAGSASVLGGGLFLALASVLLFYLLWPSYVRAVYRQELLRDRRAVVRANASGHARKPNADVQWELENEEELPGPM